MRRASVGWVLAMLSVGGVLNAQQPIPQQQPPTQSGQGSGGVAPTGSAQSNAADHLRPNYVFQVGDQILLRAFEMPEVGDSPFRVDSDGFLNLPELGRVKAAGITLENLEAEPVGTDVGDRRATSDRKPAHQGDQTEGVRGDSVTRDRDGSGWKQHQR